ncbi:hypothetical protein ACFFRR_001820 [Megaselia abdita]
MKCLLVFCAVFVYHSSGSPLPDGTHTLRMVEPDREIRFESSITEVVEGENILVKQGFFLNKQADGRWFTEVYSADSVRGTRILYSAVTAEIPTKAPSGLEKFWTLFNEFQKNINIPFNGSKFKVNALFDQ